MYINNLSDVDYSKLVRTVNLVIPSQNAKVGPPVSAVLGQVKIKVKDFCTQFNEATVVYKQGIPLRVLVFVYKGEKFDFIIKPPSVSFLVKNVLKLTGKKYITLLDVQKIMFIKKKELDYLDEIIIFRNVLAIIKSMKIELKIV